jgi:hypothetical protein
MEMVAELTGKRNLNPITSIIGAALGAIVDRPVGLDTTTIGILRERISRGAKGFLVETHPTDPHPDISCFGGASELETSDLPHQPHHSGGGSTGEEGMSGGGKGPFSNRCNGQSTKLPEKAPEPSHPAALQPEVEEGSEPGSLVLDIETFSTVVLKKVGLHFYAAHKTTGVSVACYAFGAVGAVQVWRPGEPVPEAVRRHITTGCRMVAHNAAFEATLLREVLGPRHGWPIPKPTQ